MASGASSAGESASRSDAPLRVGRYVVYPAFARGGMASVHLGRLSGTSSFVRVVAIKRMHPLFSDSKEHYQMLRDEARILSRIRHANVIPLLDVIQDGDELCLVMDYVSGVSLADLLREATAVGERITPAVACAIVGDLLRGLHAAHEARAEDGTALEVVHRDISPHNALVGADGIARVLDFGIAKALRKEHRTVSGDLKGKLSYMAPEQLRGLPATRQSDLFSTGIVLWESLTGTKLHPDGDVLSSLLDLPGKIPAPSSRASNVPPALDAVVVRALAAEPRDRFESAEEMAIALADACPPAGREQVTETLERLCGDELERRSAFARRVETDDLAAHEDERGTVSHVVPRKRRSFVGLWAIAGVVGVAGLAFAFAPRTGGGGGASTGTISGTGTGTGTGTGLSAEAPASVSAGEATPLPASAVSAPTAEPSASASARPPPPRRTKPEGSSGSPSPKPVAAPPPCVPPFSIDDAGVKRYKPECL